MSETYRSAVYRELTKDDVDHHAILAMAGQADEVIAAQYATDRALRGSLRDAQKRIAELTKERDRAETSGLQDAVRVVLALVPENRREEVWDMIAGAAAHALRDEGEVLEG